MPGLELAPGDVASATSRSTSTDGSGLLDRIVTWWALAGGLVFCAIVVMSIISIVGRKMFSGPIQGDIELVMMGSAIGAAAFLPLCEMDDHHIKVDALTTWMTERGRAVLDVLAHALLGVVSGVIAWRTVLYGIECRENGEVSSLLLIPLWIPVALLVPSFVFLALTAFRRTAASLKIARGEAR